MSDKKKKSGLSVFERLACGAAAGATGKSAVAPFQRIQIIYQVAPGETLSLSKGVKTTTDVIRNEGISALWRGNLANAARSAPTTAIKFYTQSAYYALCRDNSYFAMGNSAAQFWSGAGSGVTTVCLTYPLDLFRTKLAANAQYRGYYDCLKQTVHAYGVRGLFHGISAPVVGSIPHTGIAFWSYDYLKRAFGVDGDNPDPVRRTCAGFCAGFAGQTVTYPFSTVRRRMQISSEWQQMGLLRCFVVAARTEGVRGLFVAYSIHAFKGPISTGITFAFNDMFKGYVKRFHERRAPLYGDLQVQ